MPKNKSDRHRGSRTHGRGKKAGRGKGIRGGRGNAGLHKHKYMHLVKFMPDHFGRHGFKRPQSVVASNEVINISRLRDALPGLVEQGLATKKGKTTTVNLTELGFDKLLGTGNINEPLVVIHRDKNPSLNKMRLNKFKGRKRIFDLVKHDMAVADKLHFAVSTLIKFMIPDPRYTKKRIEHQLRKDISARLSPKAG